MTGTSGTRWLDAGQQRIWRAFIIGQHLLLDRLDRDLRTLHGISLNEYEVLVRLSESPDRSMRMAILADAMCHSRSRLTHTVNRMEREGLVRRTTSPTDRRGVEASLTQKGYTLLEAAAVDHVRGVREHLIDLASAEDLEAFGRIFDTLSDKLLTGMPPQTDIRGHA